VSASAGVLRVEGLTVEYRVGGTAFPAVRDVSFSIGSGESMGLVGESGSGKTTLGMAILRYLPENGSIAQGSIFFDGTDLVPLGRRELSRIRGNRIAMVYQNPASALNPSLRAGEQIAEVYRAHLGLGRDAARSRAPTRTGRTTGTPTSSAAGRSSASSSAWRSRWTRAC
jgi:peptide/nickel transport system ATP-binding protein